MENRLDHTTRDPYPRGDKSIYQLMTNGEIDYDNMYAAIDYSSEGWARPVADPITVRGLAAGETGAFCHLSCGPFADMAPGDSVPFTFAIVVGDKFHTRPDNFARNFDPYNPGPYRDNLDFSDLIATARAADWHYDNPGVDTDGDGYAGKFYLDNCVGNDSSRCDTVWYKGDGVPDWGGPKAPPPPAFEITTVPEAVTLRWNGSATELARDPLSGQRDFEGYRVYSARLNIRDEYALIASWDIPDNYRRFAYNESSGQWIQISHPLSTAEWRKALNNPEFDPLNHKGPSIATAYEDFVEDTIRNAAGDIVRFDTRRRLSYFPPQGPNFGNTYRDGGRELMNLIQRVGRVEKVSRRPEKRLLRRLDQEPSNLLAMTMRVIGLTVPSLRGGALFATTKQSLRRVFQRAQKACAPDCVCVATRCWRYGIQATSTTSPSSTVLLRRHRWPLSIPLHGSNRL
jgi:hypothetical protein